MNKNAKKNLRVGYLICLELLFSLLVFDQVTKKIAKSSLSGRKPFKIIKNVFELNYLEGGNKGAAWGMLKGHIGLLAVLSIIISILAILLIVRIEYLIHAEGFDKEKILKINLIKVLLIFFAAGAIGNAIDRIFRGYVIDFIYFKLIDFPIFNIADCYVVVSTIVLAIMFIFFVKDEELEIIFKKKNNLNNVTANEEK